MKYTFCIQEEYEKEFEDWQAKIKELFGSVGSNTFIFKPNSIGESLVIKNSHGCELDLSHEEDW